MPDPITLAVLGGVAATEGIKFLYGQASELLKAWRERRNDDPAAEVSGPIADSPALDRQPTQRAADAAVIKQEYRDLLQLTGALSPYALGQVDVDLHDEKLSEQAGRLRALLEAVYHQRFTFIGEKRDPTGSQVTVRQALGDVEGPVLGAEASVADGELHVEQVVQNVRPPGSVTGFKGKLG